MSATRAIDELVAAARAQARLSDGDKRRALTHVLEHLDVKPGDAAWADGRDVVGEAFERLTPPSTRRRLGQFFTPLWIARPMAEWLLAEQPRLLLDPGVGSGALMIGAAHARGRGRTQLLGIDVDPLALRLIASTQRLREIKQLDLRQMDFLLEDLVERPQAVICNPPYTRHQDLPLDVKDAIHNGLSSRLQRKISRLASLHVLFLLRTLEITDETARIAFLTPAHWLDMNYGREIKALLLERAHVEAMITFPVRDRVFDHAVTTAAVTLIRKVPGGETPTRLVRLRSRDSNEAGLRAAINGEATSRGVILRADRRWTGGVPVSRRGKVLTLGDVARVRRGIATGCNEFFVLSEARRNELDIDACHLVPCAASPRSFSGETLSTSHLAEMDPTKPRWLLNITKAPRSGPLARYLRYGRVELAVRQRRLVRDRESAGRKWFEVEPGFDAPILFRYLNSSPPRLVRNLAQAVPLNNWLAICPHDGVDADSLYAVLTRVTGIRSIEAGSRHYGKGLWKLEPRELASLALPDIASHLGSPSVAVSRTPAA